MIKGAQDDPRTHTAEDGAGLGGVLAVASGLVALAVLLSLAAPW